jgi:hypothetical protein
MTCHGRGQRVDLAARPDLEIGDVGPSGSLILAVLVGRILRALGQNAPTPGPQQSSAIISKQTSRLRIIRSEARSHADYTGPRAPRTGRGAPMFASRQVCK